jgi:hypothetical protein
MDYNKYYFEQAGNGANVNVYKGQMYQKGYGLGGMFKRFFSWIIPIVKKHAMPAVETGLKTVASQVVNSTADLAKDAISGKNIRESATTHFNTGVDNLKNKVEKALDGKGIKRKKKKKNKTNLIILKKSKNKTKTRSLDIFDKNEF